MKVDDGEHRPYNELVKQTSKALYTNIRCPFFDSGGLVGGSDFGIAIGKVHPGHGDLAKAEQRIEELTKQPTLNGQVVFKIDYRCYILYVDYFYWCVRKMVERFAADPDNAKLIREHSARPK